MTPSPAVHRKRRILLLAGFAAVVALSLVSLGTGAADIGPAEALRALVSSTGLVDVAPATSAVVLELRLPRLLLSFAAGAALAVAGALLQGLFRNPLADPGVLGITTGGALGVLALLVLAPGLALGTLVGGMVALPLAAATGAAATLAAVQLLAGGGRTHPATLLLTGLAVQALLAAALGLLLQQADSAALRRFTFWTLGSLAEASPGTLLAALPLLAIGFAGALMLARPLDALALGEAEAFHLGQDVRALQRALVATAALLAGTTVALCGAIGFVGLVAPHLVRLAVGPSHRFLIPACAMVGAILVTLADILARQLGGAGEIPIGILTSLLGAPFFLALLRGRHRLDLG